MYLFSRNDNNRSVATSRLSTETNNELTVEIIFIAGIQTSHGSKVNIRTSRFGQYAV